MDSKPRKIIDVNSPDDVGADPHSKPVIVGHHPTMPDPMVHERPQAKEPEPDDHKVEVKTSDIKPSSMIGEQAPKSKLKPEIGLGDISDPVDKHDIEKKEPETIPERKPDDPGLDNRPIVDMPAASTADKVHAPADHKAPLPGNPPVEHEEPLIPKDPLTIPAGPGVGHSRGIHKIIIALGLFLLVFMGIYLVLDAKATNLNLPFEVFKDKEAAAPVSPTPASPVPIATPITPPSSSQNVESWDTYEKKNLDLSVRYPKEWQLKEERLDNNITPQILLLTSIFNPDSKDLESSLSSGGYLHIQVDEADSDKRFVDERLGEKNDNTEYYYWDKQGEKVVLSYFTFKEATKIDGIDALKGSCGHGTKGACTYLLYKDKLLSFSYFYTDEGKYLKEYDKFIESIQLL